MRLMDKLTKLADEHGWEYGGGRGGQHVFRRRCGAHVVRLTVWKTGYGGASLMHRRWPDLGSCINVHTLGDTSCPLRELMPGLRDVDVTVRTIFEELDSDQKIDRVVWEHLKRIAEDRVRTTHTELRIAGGELQELLEDEPPKEETDACR